MIIKKYTTKLNENKINILVEECHKEIKDYTMKFPSEITAALNEAFDLQNLAEEYLYMLAYTAGGDLIGVFEVSHGAINQSIAGPREVFIRALLCGAGYIILAHNHPSGSAIPSKSDVDVTELMYRAGYLIHVPLMDHIIIGEKGSYYSFAEEKAMPKL